MAQRYTKKQETRGTGNLAFAMFIILSIIGCTAFTAVVLYRENSQQPSLMSTTQANSFIANNWQPFWSDGGSHYVVGSAYLGNVIQGGKTVEILWNTAITTEIMNDSAWRLIGLTAKTIIVLVNANFSINAQPTKSFAVIIQNFVGQSGRLTEFYAYGCDLAALNQTALINGGYSFKDV